MTKNTKYINIFGGPGAGKSTNATRLFSEMKMQYLDVELVTEVAKDFVWEERFKTLQIQPYITIKQFRNLYRLHGKVDYVITDAPVLLGLLYEQHYNTGMPKSYSSFILDIHETLLNPSVNVYLERNHMYDENGRYQTEEEAHKLDKQLRKMLREIIPGIITHNTEKVLTVNDIL